MISRRDAAAAPAAADDTFAADTATAAMPPCHAFHMLSTFFDGAIARFRHSLLTRR